MTENFPKFISNTKQTQEVWEHQTGLQRQIIFKLQKIKNKEKRGKYTLTTEEER